MKTDQIGCTSRELTYSDERIIATPEVNITSGISTSGSSAHVQRGSTPSIRMKTKTATMFAARLSSDVTTTDSGITSRGKCILRTSDSRCSTARTDCVVDSLTNM